MTRDDTEGEAEGGAPIAHLRARATLHAVPGDGEEEGRAVDEDAMRAALMALRQRHRDLDLAIAALQAQGSDPFTVRRLKKRKLALRDRISAIEDELTPDIIA